MSEENKKSPLTEDQQKELYRLQQFYWAEAERCEKTGAHLAGCVMLGSAVECLLLLFTNIFFDEALKTEQVPQHGNGKTKYLLEWTLADLLRVAKAANWFPETIEGKKASIRDSSGTLKQIRAGALAGWGVPPRPRSVADRGYRYNEQKVRRGSVSCMEPLTELLDANRRCVTIAVVIRKPQARLAPKKISVARLPVSGSDVFGREEVASRQTDCGWQSPPIK